MFLLLYVFASIARLGGKLKQMSERGMVMRRLVLGCFLIITVAGCKGNWEASRYAPTEQGYQYSESKAFIPYDEPQGVPSNQPRAPGYVAPQPQLWAQPQQPVVPANPYYENDRGYIPPPNYYPPVMPYPSQPYYAQPVPIPAQPYAQPYLPSVASQPSRLVDRISGVSSKPIGDPIKTRPDPKLQRYVDNDAQYRKPDRNGYYEDNDANYYPLNPIGGQDTTKGIYQPFATDELVPYEEWQVLEDNDQNYYPLYFYVD